MPLQLVIGRSGAGKTERCLEEIREELRIAPEGPPLILLVPEQATFQSEYAMLRLGGLSGTIRAQALSFRRLAFRVMQETGGTSLVPINDTGKHMLLYKLVHRMAPELQLFAGGAEQPGFIERLTELLTEWKRYGLQEEQLLDSRELIDGSSSNLLRRKLHDLMLIYREMERELGGKYIDSEDYLHYLREGFAESPSMQGARIWVDGFHGFTPTEFEALGALMAGAAHMTVTLTLNRPYLDGVSPHELELFHPTAETCLKLMELAESAGIEVLPPISMPAPEQGRFRDNRMLAHLERHYGSKVAMLQSSAESYHCHHPACGVSLHAAASKRAEVEAVARDLVRRVREDGYRWRDMAVMTRNAEEYADYISLIFKDYEIPFFLDQKKKALHHPLVEYIRSALETVLYGWRYDAMFRCIKTEMVLPLDNSLPREWFDLLENYVLAAGIDGWKWLDASRWRPMMSHSLEDEGVDGISAAAKRELDIALAAREAVVPLLRRFEQGLRKATTVQEMCEALYRLLDHSDAADRLERWSRQDMERGDAQSARSHRQLWDGVMALLDQLVELAGEERVAPELFAGMIEAGLDSLKLASVPPALDQVLVGSMDRTRSAGVQVCYLLGANDGTLPMRVKEDGILTEPEREQLAETGLQMAPGARRRLLDERFMIYNALTTPSKHLWLSWAGADEEGKGLLPSEIVRQMKAMFPGIPIHTEVLAPEADMPPEEQTAFLQHPERSISHLIVKLREWHQGGDIAPLWWGLYNWYAVRPQWQQKLGVLVSSLVHHNRENNLSIATASQLFGERMQVSVSRMERFVSCSFQHFAIHGLKLKERRLYRLGAPDMGQLFHAALSGLAKELGPRWGKLSRQEIKAEADRTVGELVPKLQSEILLSSSRFQFVARKLKDIVAQAAVVLGEHARRAEFHTVGTEVDFGPNGTLPSLVIPLSEGKELEVIGRIDRVDAAESDGSLLLRVLDYKSSAMGLKLEEVVHGLSLQMLAYLDVLVTHAGSWLGREAKPAGVLYFHVHNPMMTMNNRLPADEADNQLLKRYKMRGLLTAEPDIARMMDGGLDTGYSELLPVALKRDGSFYSSSSVVTAEQWDILRGSVRSRIRRIGQTIQQGEIAITPYRMGGKSPCQFCDYKPLCQFDPLFQGNAYNVLGKRADIWEQLARDCQEEVERHDRAEAGEQHMDG
ncbi:helicase-exonuclease AddAB subunit AddB [Paenibacillus sp. J5C_2022]|uniref:helicase-exonuclease AddAB subunit AddB n=1 Tax=Paenibacillus sp. J5C2022 TaxID=2977129 RepID=UPI0021CE0D49|nr:helicase-exonuclease AddAB subunit AddB [Paenibacillus sp. J5C2022]MCU6707664.1 helicase-exonuclease AddAB subunit AddB [Paenibacillus sp. J5C2022]